MSICKNCGYFTDEEEGEYCSYCFQLDFENNIDEFFDILETELTITLDKEVE
jgi:RNA polymerase subunit RPABC4/transcription elongation factor Spt4